MKDELAGQFMLQFAATGPKNYAYEYMKIDGTLDQDARCKGISKSYTPKFKEYLNSVQGKAGNEVRKTCFRINSKNHELFTIKSNKVAMRNTVIKRIKDPNVEYETLLFMPAGFVQ